MTTTYRLKILRGITQKQYWEEFTLPYSPGANIISSLMEIQKHPQNSAGQATTPVVWEQGCLEEVCGSCSMLINGIPRQACSGLIAPLIAHHNTVTLAPLSKFPLIRDLHVDRTRLFDSLKKIKGWISPSEESTPSSFGPPLTPEIQRMLYLLATCMTCGCCSESCPQVHEKSPFIGPAALSQVRLFNTHPLGTVDKASRLRSLLGEEGISACGNAQNCRRVCPKKIPLTESIAQMGRETTKQVLKDLCSFD